jgi:ABC-2 type transport system permease protein
VPFRGFGRCLRAATGGAILLTAKSQVYYLHSGDEPFVSRQLALITGFLPAFPAVGVLFEISRCLAEPWITRVIPARYLVTSLQSVFLAGDIWPLFLPMMGFLGVLSAVFLTVTFMKTPRRVE